MTSSTSTMLSPSVLPAMPADSGLLHLSMAISDDSSNSLSRTPVSVLPPELSYINQEAVDNHSRHGTLTMGGFGGDANTDDDIDVSGESLPPLPGGGLNFGGPPQLPNRGGGGGGAMPPPVPNTPRPTASFSGDMPPPVPNTPRPGSISMSSSLQMSPGAPPPVPDSPRPRPSVSQQPQPQPTSMFPPGMIPMELRRELEPRRGGRKRLE